MTVQVPSGSAPNLSRTMLALLVCEDRECRAAFEAEGRPDAIESLRCEDCGGSLRAVGFADAEPHSGGHVGGTDVRRAA